MKEEFNLSDKINWKAMFPMAKAEDVKEFIKRLKEEFESFELKAISSKGDRGQGVEEILYWFYHDWKDFEDKMEKLAGDKLI